MMIRGEIREEGTRVGRKMKNKRVLALLELVFCLTYLTKQMVSILVKGMSINLYTAVSLNHQINMIEKDLNIVIMHTS